MAREISNKNFGTIVDSFPTGFLKSEQFITLLDLVSDGAEIEGFATPSKNSIAIPTSMLRPASPDSPEFTTTEEKTYIELAQKDIFLDGRAVRSLSGSENIRNTSLAIRTAQENQPIMSGVNELSQNVPVSGDTTVKNNRNAEANKVTQSINAGTNLNNTPRAVIVTLQWLSLRQISFDDGSSVPLGIGAKGNPFRGENGNVLIKIRLRSNTGSVLVTSRYQMNGVSVGPFSKDYRIEIPSSVYLTESARTSNFPITVEVLREDIEFRQNNAIGRHPFDDDGNNLYEEGSKRFTEFRIQSIRTIIPQIENITNFFGSAYIGLRYSAEQFPNIPQRKYFIRGIKVKIPTGVTVDVADSGRIIYPDVYTFASLTTTKHWTSDPAWILFALLTEDYGLNIPDAKIDKASFYAASAHSSVLIGGKPRYSFNGVIKTRKKALEIIKEIAALMRATLYYRQGSLKIALDKPETTISYLFTNANVIDGVFNYSGLDKDKKYTQINVSYFNNDIQELDQVSIRDEEKITLFGLNQANIQASYTTDRQQAIRYGRSVLYSSHFEGEIVTFDCGLEAASVLEPFMLIKIVDRTKELIRASGRINAVTSSTVVVVDDDANTSVGEIGDSFLIIDKNGGVQEKTISAVSGVTVTLSSALNPLPQVNTIWAVKTGNIQHRKFRITNIKQKNNAIFTITAIFYDDNKYEFIDGDNSAFDVEKLPTTLLDLLPAPEIQQLKEETIVVNKRAQSRIVLNFAHVDGARSYQVAYKLEDGEPVVVNIQDNQFILNNNKAGKYEFSIKTINSSFITSLNSSVRILNAFGLSAAPTNVVNLRFEESGDDLTLKWDRATDPDVLFGGKVKISFGEGVDGTTQFQNSSFVVDVDGNSDQAVIPQYKSGEYFVKFEDVDGNQSSTATSVVVNRLIASDLLLAGQIRENSNNFQGAKTNVVYDSSIGGLKLTSGTTIDSLTDFNTLALADGTTYSTIDDVVGGVSSSGSYTFQNTIDLGDIFRFRIQTHLKKSGFSINTLFDSFTDNIDTWPDIFTSSAPTFETTPTVNFKIAVSNTATPSTTFEELRDTDIVGRTLSFKVEIENNSGYENIDIEELGVNVFFKPRTESSINNSAATAGILTSSGSGQTTVNFIKKFFMGTTAVGGSTTVFSPTILINVNNMQTGDFFTIDNVTSSQFVLSIKNGSSFVARQFTYNAFGYGEG